MGTSWLQSLVVYTNTNVLGYKYTISTYLLVYYIYINLFNFVEKTEFGDLEIFKIIFSFVVDAFPRFL